MLIGAAALDRSKPLSLRYAYAAFSARPAAIAAIVVSAVAVFAAEALTIYFVSGANLLTADSAIDDLSSAAIFGSVAIGALASLPLAFVPFAVLFSEASFADAFASSMRGFALNVAPLLIFAALAVLLVVLGLLLMGVGLIAVYPLLVGGDLRRVEGHLRRVEGKRLGCRRDVESSELSFGRRRLDTGHARSGGTAPRPRDDGVDFMRWPCDNGLDAAVAAVSHPAAKLAGARLVGKRIAKSHALHAAAYDQTQRDRIGAARRAHRRASPSRRASNRSPSIVFTSVISPRSIQASASSRVVVKVSTNSPASSFAPTNLRSSAM